MKVNKSLRIFAFILAISTLLFVTGCEPAPEITFNNQQNQEVKIFATHVRDDGTTSNYVEQGIVPASATKIITITFLGDEWVNRIEARNPSGEVVFSHDYNMDDLEEMDWIIVIPPSQNN